MTPVSTSVLLKKVLSSESFRNSGRSSKLLRFIFERAATGDADGLKEYSLGAEALGRGPSFDPRVDSIVRVEVSRLRNRLEHYYATEGQEDPLRIVLPKGGYIPRWEAREASAGASTASMRPQLRRVWLASTAVAIAVLAAMWIWLSGGSARRGEEPLQVFDVRLLEGAQVGGGTVGTHVVLSPDGTRVVFVAWGTDGVSRLFTRRLSETEAVELPGTEGAQSPLFSPDAAWVAFISTRDRKLKKTPVTGGSPIDLATATDVLGASWGDNNEIIAKLDATPLLWKVPADGTAPTPLSHLRLPRDADPRMWMQVLPGSRSLIVTIARQRGFDAAEIAVLSLSDGSLKTLVRGGTFGRYVASGHLVYINQGTLYAVPFSIDRLELQGSPRPVLRGIDYNPLFGYAQFDFSRTGLLAYRRSASDGPFEIHWIERSRHERAVHRQGRYSWPRISPNGSTLALVRQESAGSSLWMESLSAAQSLPVTAGDEIVTSPVWAPDGKHLVFWSAGSGIMLAPADGTSKPRVLLRDNGVLAPWSFQPDGGRLAYQLRSREGAQFDLWTVPVEQSATGLQTGTPEPFLATPAIEVFPTFSPDGKWMAYLSNRSGAFELYARPFPNSGTGEIQLSRGGAMVFRWPVKADEIFYRTPNQKIMVLKVRTGAGKLDFSEPKLWSEVELADTGVFPNFEVTPDGRRVAALLKAGNEAAANVSHVTIAVNFSTELRRRLAVSER